LTDEDAPEPTGRGQGQGPSRVDEEPQVVALVGPTASGKSEIALRVALESGLHPDPMGRTAGELEVELVSVDSMAVYRGMDIGTAKPSAAVRARVHYHLLDLADPWEEFTVQEFQAAARRAQAEIAERGRHALLVGGTGLHLRSLVDDLSFPGRYPQVAAEITADLDALGPDGSPAERRGLEALHERLTRLDPVASRRIEPTNRRRLVRALEVTIGSGRPFSSYGPGLERYPPTSVVQVGLRPDPSLLDLRIAERFVRLMDAGLLEEVRALSERPEGISRTARQALGYRELLSHIEDGISLADAVDQAIRRTRAFARRQMAWYRRDPRIVWLESDDDPVGWIAAHFEGTSRRAGQRWENDQDRDNDNRPRPPDSPPHEAPRGGKRFSGTR
jgi:tRNA dimethylallyltransferase